MKKAIQKFSLIISISLILLTSCSKDNTDNGSQSGTGSVIDIDNNTYATIKIGTQVWMAENLKTTHYRNGDAILQAVDSADWDDLTVGACCSYFDDNDTYAPIYGRLYNWLSVKDSRNIAPAGWHIPTDTEWQTLINYLGGTASAGGKMKATSSLWLSPNAEASNSSGINALPGGYRHYNGKCTGKGEQSYWWSSTEKDVDYSWYYTLLYNYGVANPNINRKNDLMSIRCIKD